jgi:hypothetical protein
MTTANGKGHRYFERAFELAYSIHVNKDVAFFVAEDALGELPLLLGNQKKNRKRSSLLSGFWKAGERTRPVRQTIKLNEGQMLQWLVYKQSQVWERRTERGEGLYLPTDEDMIVRYLEHLVFLTLRRGSFYVTLAIAQLLYQFDRRETRLLHDILTQSDSARMKDMGYIGKQRLELLGRICLRFGNMIQTVKTARGEKQLLMRPTTQPVFALVEECLRRFTPWDTACIVKPGFDVTDIPSLYFTGDGGSDEDQVEMDRIHTLLDPDCFARFADGLSKYVRTLPVDNQDKGCDYGSLDERLAVPQFSNSPGGPARGDRFQAPDLTEEDYIRLERMLEARARRRKDFTPRQLCVYVDGAPVQSFEPGRAARAEFLIGRDAGVIEVRGRDDEGELTLAILFVEFCQIPMAGAFRDSVKHHGGRRVEVQLTPARGASAEDEGTLVEVRYTERPWFGMTGLTRSDRYSWERARAQYSWLVKPGLALLLIVVALIIVWFQLLPGRQEVSPPQQAEQPPILEEQPHTPVPQPAPPEQPGPSKESAPMIARAIWSTDPQTVLLAIPIEATRGEVKTVDLSRRQIRLLLSLPLYDGSRPYPRYRVTLAAADKRLWGRTLHAPTTGLTDNAHILNLVLFPGQLSATGPYDLQVEGWTQGVWQPLGHVLLNPVK